MAKNSRSLPVKIQGWRLLVDNGRKELGHLTHVQGDLEELERTAQEVDILRSQQTQALVALREITFKVRTLTKHADRIRGRLGASLRGHYGYDNLALIRYGFKPREHVRTLFEENEVVDAVNTKPGDETPQAEETGADE